MLPLTQGFFKALIAGFLVPVGILYATDAGAERVMRAGVVLADRLNLRSRPGIASPPVTVLKSGTRVRVLDREGGWLKVLHEQTSGYVRYLPEYIRILSNELENDPSGTPIRLLEEKASRIERNIETSRDRVRTLAGRETAVLDRLNKTERSLNRMDRQRIHIQSQMDALQKKIETLEILSKKLARQVNTTQAYALKRLVALYKLNQMGTLHFLASARSVHEYLYLEKGLGLILARDEAVLSVLSGRRTALHVALDDLKKKTREKQVLEQTYRTQMAAMAEETAERAALLKAIRNQKELQLASIQDLKRAADRLEETLKTLRRRMTSTEPALEKTGAFSAMKGLLEMPVEGKVVGRFGTYKTDHLQADAQRNGIEIETGTGSPVKAVFGGKVVFSDWFRRYGNLIIIDHGEGFFTVYAHARELFKENGEGVETGEVIATVGESGFREGPSLYFEVRHHDKPVDPLSWIKER